MPKTPIDRVLAEFLPDEPTNVKQALRLNVDATVLNRIRNGRIRLTPASAEKLAASLPGDAQRRELFASRLVSAGEHTFSPSGSTASVQRAVDLFARLGSPGSLLCVEYRDLPRAGINQKYSWMLPHVGSAVVAGMHFAMFQPFGRLSTGVGRSSRPGSVAAFEYNVIAAVHEVYAQMRTAIREKAEQEGVDPSEAQRRLVLFERDRESNGLGFQSRLFCARTAQGRPEVFEWISAHGEDLFVERDGIDPVAAYQQFFEITSYFEVYKKLPQTSLDLRDKRSQAFMRDNWSVGVGQAPQWTVYGDRRIRERHRTR